MENAEINKKLSDNESYLKNKIGESFDTKYRHLNIPALNHSEAFVVYISGMIDVRIIDETILEPLMKYSYQSKEKFHLKSRTYTSYLMDVLLTIAKTNRMQYFLMIPNLIFGKAIGITAGVMARKIGADTWLSMTIGFVIGISVMLLITYLCSRFPDKTIIQFSEELCGKWIGRGIGLILAVLCGSCRPVFAARIRHVITHKCYYGYRDNTRCKIYKFISTCR